MEFSKIKNILFNSKEIQQIPDKWEESIPIMCNVNGVETVAFLYWSSSDKMILKQIIGIDISTGEIILLKETEIIEKFKLTSFAFDLIQIDDYVEHFSKKDKYEKIFEKLCASDMAFSSYGQEELSLLKSLVGDEIFNNVLTVIASSYIKKLSQ